jgi:hypothetical protein
MLLELKIIKLEHDNLEILKFYMHSCIDPRPPPPENPAQSWHHHRHHQLLLLLLQLQLLLLQKVRQHLS